jgi:Bifunctional DNA primase/polymerase, N-terminal
MADRLPEAMRYKAQGFRPIPCRPGTKQAALRWERYQARPLTAQAMHAAWPRKSNANIALILGPAANLLVLNVNVKHGHDGRRTLRQRAFLLPKTPEIATPTGGSAYCFRVPNIASTFGVYIYPDGFDGLEFRGWGGYQLVPSSRVKDGSYRFAERWTLERLVVDLAEMPAWLLQAWLALDRDTPQPSTHDTAPDRKATGHHGTATANYLTTKTTALSSEEDSDLTEFGDRGCAAYISRRVGLDVARLDDGQSFLCILPGHRERTPSATWFRTSNGYYIYHDWHQRSSHAYYPVPDVYAALVTGKLKRLPKPSRKTWRLRLMIEAGLLAPYPVEMKTLPAEMPALLRQFCEGFRLLCACKWTYQE